MHLIEALFASQWNFLALFFHFSPLRMQLSWTFLGLIHFSARYIYCACVYVCVHAGVYWYSCLCVFLTQKCIVRQLRWPVFGNAVVQLTTLKELSAARASQLLI